MKNIYCKDDAWAMDEIRAELKNGNEVKVHNEYETFYGVGFDRWLRDGLSDIMCEIEVTTYNQHCN